MQETFVPWPDADWNHIERAVQECCAVAHPEHPKPFGPSHGIKAGSIVAGAHFDRSRSFYYLDHAARGAAVLDRVGQRLLDNPVHRELQLARMTLSCSPAFVSELDGRVDDQSVGAHPFCERFDRRLGSELVEDRRAEFCDQRAKARHIALELADGRANSPRQHVCAAGAVSRPQGDSQCREVLERLVVQLSRPPRSFMLTGGEPLALLLGRDRLSRRDWGRGGLLVRPG